MGVVIGGMSRMPIDRYEFGGLIFSIIYEFSKIQRHMSNSAGLYSGQPRVLTILKDNEGCTLSELSQLCGVGMPSLSVSLRNMEKTGLIYKQADENGSRMQSLYLTETGLQKAMIFHEQIDLFFKEFLASLEGDVADQMNELLLRLKEYFTTFNLKHGEEE
jgi:MarR family transcriptional regulator, organic hydroperoxide resistance regulator